MAALKIANDIYSVGILNPSMRVFDVIMRTDYGTSYNSYVVKGKERTALIDTNHKTFWQQYLSNISEVTAFDAIDYIILNHNEPDHSGALTELMKLAKNATVVASQAGSFYLKGITNRPDLNVQVVKDGDIIDLGGKTLRFINAPFLHWPDSMFTWVEEEKVLFSCDFLGTHYCEPYGFDTNVAYPDKYKTAFKGYYDAIFGPFGPYVRQGLEKIRDLPIQIVATSHGPILTREGFFEEAIRCYELWSRPVVHEKPLVPIFYCTAYGNTRLVAEQLKEGMYSVIPDIDCELYDLIDEDMGQMQKLLNQCDAFLVGSPTINRDALPPVWELLSHVDAINNQKKPCLAFGSYGWSGEAVPNLNARMKGLKMDVFGEGLKINLVPSHEELRKAWETGEAFAQVIKK